MTDGNTFGMFEGDAEVTVVRTSGGLSESGNICASNGEIEIVIF